MNLPEKIAIGAVLAGGGFLGWLLYHKFSRDTQPPKTQPPADAFARTVAKALSAKHNLKPNAPGDSGKLDRLRYVFLYRRALSKGLADVSLQSGPGLQTLQQSVDGEYAKVETYWNSLLGTSTQRSPYYGGFDPLEEQGLHGGEGRHLDLGKAFQWRIGDPPATTEADAVAQTANPNFVQRATLGELDRRRMHVLGIVWREMAIDLDLWKGVDAGKALADVPEPTLMLDRRLRAIERLLYQVSAGVTANGIGSSAIERVWIDSNAISTTKGPWKDRYLARQFEMPSLPRTSKSPNGIWNAADFFLNIRTVTWTLRVPPSATGGDFTLTLDGDVTDPIDFHAAAADVKAALQAVIGVGRRSRRRRSQRAE